MTIDEIVGFVADLEDVLTVSPTPGDGSPEIAWGDTFVYFSPDGVVPAGTQPFASIVTKNYPDDEASHLERPDAFRVNIGAGTAAFTGWTGHAPREPNPSDDPSTDDAVFAHPVYGYLGWLAVVNPGPRTEAVVRELLVTAYQLARARHERRRAARSARSRDS